MAYSYELKLGGSTYKEFYPSNQIKLVGGWEVGTMIWREKIGDIKIGRLNNTVVYNSLEAWFDDPTKFSTRIRVKILNDSVEESVHWFGIKWGTINEYQKTYTVTPIPYDLWGQYFEATKDVLNPISITSSETWQYYGEGTTYPLVQGFFSDALLEDVVKDLATVNSGWSTADVVSSFLWQSNYEDATAVGTYQGMPLDYVTSAQSFLGKAGMIVKAGKSFTDILEWLTLLRVFVFFDDNDKLRFEHIKFFNDRLTDNAVDYSSLMKVSDEKYSYIDPSIATLESIQMDQGDDDSDLDFSKSDITYSDIINRPDAQPIDYTSSLFSNIASIATLITDDLSWFSGLANNIYKWFDIDMTSFTSDFNYFDIVWDTGGGNDFCGSNDFRNYGVTTDYDFIADIDSISGTFDAYLKDRSAGTTISNKITINSTGVSTGIITPTVAATDSYLALEGTIGATGSAAGWISLSNNDRLLVPTIDGFTSGTPKTNGAMSVANIVDKWWRDDRLSRTATFNSTGYAATSTIFNLARDTINVYLGISTAADWFLPSKDELNEMYTELHAQGVGGFTTANYWSSSENAATNAWKQEFIGGAQAAFTKSQTISVRACRTFTASVGKYSLRDIGPSGGLIFYISGTTYYEAAPSDQSTSKAWSNLLTAISTTGTAIGTGQDNTDDIIAQVGHTDSAAKLCDDLTTAANINPLYGWNDGTRIAKIDKWTRNLKTGYYQIDLIYQEDD